MQKKVPRKHPTVAGVGITPMMIAAVEGVAPAMTVVVEGRAAEAKGTVIAVVRNT